MATLFEYRPIPPHGTPRLARISDNTNHPKYSLSPVLSLSRSIFCSGSSLSPSRSRVFSLSPFLLLPRSSLALSAGSHSPSDIKTFEDETPASVLHRATLGYGRKISGRESMSGRARVFIFSVPAQWRRAGFSEVASR